MAFDKLKFWKKDDDLGLENDPFASPESKDPFAEDPVGQATQQQDPLGGQQPAAQDPFSSQQDPFATQGQSAQQDPFASQNQPAQQQFAQQPGQQYQQPFGRERYPEMAQQAQPASAPKSSDHDTELILTRLDILKAMLEGINQRLANLERKQSNEYKW